MDSLRAALLATVVVLPLGARPGLAQEPPRPPAASAPAAESRTILRLTRLRNFIENTDDSDVSRTLHAEELLADGSAEAIDLSVELLGPGADASTWRVMCRAIATSGAVNRIALDGRLVPPLIDRLGAERPDVRAAAAAALASFNDPAVIDTVSAVARDASARLLTRQAAVEVLAASTNRRPVVGALVALLEIDEPALRGQIAGVLGGLTDLDAQQDPSVWRAWWQEQALLGEQAWLDRQLMHHARQNRQLREDLANLRISADERYVRLAGRLAAALAAQYRLTQETDKQRLLAGWLDSPIEVCRLEAVRLVGERISEGQLPTDDLRVAQRRCYADPSAAVRIRAIEVIGATNDPNEAAALLERLPAEGDPAVRAVLLRTLGNLRNASAIQPLLGELARPEATPVGVAAAADAVALLAATLEDAPTELMDDLVETIKATFARTPADEVGARRALLGAMAAIGDPAFKPEFESNLSAELPELLLEAIQGVAVVGNGAQLNRLSTLVSHPDARVRQRALEALGALGTPAQLVTIVPRLDPSTESLEGPRDAAWKAFQQIIGRLPISGQLGAVQRLEAMPTRATEYLQILYTRYAAMSTPPPELNAIRRQLAERYVDLGRNSEALRLWKELFSAARTSGNPQQCEYGRDVLISALACRRFDALIEVLTASADCPDGQPLALESAIMAHWDKLEAADQQDEVLALANALRPIPSTRFPKLAARIASTPESRPADTP